MGLSADSAGPSAVPALPGGGRPLPLPEAAVGWVSAAEVLVVPTQQHIAHR